MNPYIIIAILIAWIGSLAAVGHWQNGTGHTANGSEPLGANEFLLGALQAGAHPIKCSRNFGHFVSAAPRQGKGKIAHLQSAHPRY